MFESTTWHENFPDFFIILRRYTVIGKKFNDFKWQKQGSLRSFRSLTGWACIANTNGIEGLMPAELAKDLFGNLSVHSLKGDLSNATPFHPTSFLIDQYLQTDKQCFHAVTKIFRFYVDIRLSGRSKVAGPSDRRGEVTGSPHGRREQAGSSSLLHSNAQFDPRVGIAGR